MYCDMAVGSWMNSFRRFGISSIFTVKHSILALLDTEDEGETSEIYPATRRHIPEDLILSKTAVRTLNLANNKHIFTSTLHFLYSKFCRMCLQEDQEITPRGGLLPFCRPSTVCITAGPFISSQYELSCPLSVSVLALCYQPSYHNCSCHRPDMAIKVLPHRCQQIIIALG